MSIEIIACVSSNHGLGKDDELLFKISNDLKNFKKKTENQIVIFGRKTFESILAMNGKPLPNRINVVLTKNKKYKAPTGVFVFNSVEDIIKSCKTMNENDKKVMVCGGEYIYKEFLPYADKIHLTHVHKIIEEANVFYPMDLQEELGFKEIDTSEYMYDEKHDVYYQFVTYEKGEREDGEE